jgi:16S rRNA (cytosine1402-N4)-methyltransferase
MVQPPLTETAPSAPSPAPHVPVMLAEVMAALAPVAGELHIDGTFGAGGYSRAMLEAADCRVLAFDRDITAVRAAGVPGAICTQFADRLRVINRPFSAMEEFARIEETPDGMPLRVGSFVDGVVLDIGVSSMQLDQAARGFSFQTDGPLDMRMSAPVDPLTGEAVDTGPSAADFVNSAAEETIANVIYDYGEERRSRAIAAAIVRQRAIAPIATTLDLARLVSRVMGGRREDGRHPATRTFQALRIHVNDELGELRTGLAAALRVLKPGGRLVVVTFHSLEDRIVKQFFAEHSGRQSQGSRHLPQAEGGRVEPRLRVVNQRPLTPRQPELDANPRARSARLRAGLII